ncbi:MAG: hypothetical protein RJQ09_04035 [Cyclobacteriaceae bacterium]
MKNGLLSIVSIILFLLSSSNIKAQDLDFSSVLSGGTEDAEIYLNGYINPFMKGFGYGLTNGWYNTAETHKKFGVDLTITGNLAYVPDNDLFFNATFNTLTVSGSGDLPTVFGPDANSTMNFSTTQQVTYTDPESGQTVMENATITGQFDAPDGLDLEEEVGSSFVPVPMVQLGVGLVKQTDLNLRLIPKISTDDFEMNMWGLGVKHGIKQWIPGIKHIPIDLSVFLGYTKLKAENDLSGVGLDGTDQVAEYNVNSFTMQALVSKKLSVLTLYSGLGFNSTSSNLAMKGTYVIEGTTEVTTSNGTETVDSSYDIIDPIDLDFSSSGPRITFGARLKLFILTLHGAYTIQEYNTLTVGLGFWVR